MDEIIKRRRTISVSDNNSFKKAIEALNECFGKSYKEGNDRTHALYNVGDGCMVWFPMLAKKQGGQYEPGSKTVNWKNIIEDDGKTIIEFLNHGEPEKKDGNEPVLKRESIPMHTFMKIKEHDYRYVGTFMRDYNCSSNRRRLYRRIRDIIDLSEWASGTNYEYYDFSEKGREVFKSFYINHNYKKQKNYIKQFLDKKDTIAAEKTYSSIKSRFKFKISDLNKMTDSKYEEEFVPTLTDALNSLFSSNYQRESIRAAIGIREQFGKTLTNLLTDNETSLNDKIQDNEFGSSILAAQILVLYSDSSETFLYTFEEDIVDRALLALGIHTEAEDTLVNKQSKLYYWRYCDDEILDWPVYKYYLFLCFMADIKRANVKYVQAPKPVVEKRIVSQVKEYDEEIKADTLNDAPSAFEYLEMPRAKEITSNASFYKGETIPRHQDRKRNALAKACYCCEIDKNHPTFLRRNSDKQYTETHHLIPMEYSQQFRYTLDTEENIVSLCSNCHNQIHYGKGAEKLLKQLYEARKDLLAAAGIDETESGIKIDFEQLLHMYGLD
ncbi:MAG: HNH endonuclease [Lachnospiraceae bacterium]|nr:HNH endonuclease [Lachnospiraceae bacterium]